MKIGGASSDAARMRSGRPSFLMLVTAALAAVTAAGAAGAQIPKLSSRLAGTPLRFGPQPIHPPTSMIAPTAPPTQDIAPTPALAPVPGPPSGIGARWVEIEHGPGWVVYVDSTSTSGGFQDRTARVASGYVSNGQLVLDVTSNVVDCSNRVRVSLQGGGQSRRSVIPRNGAGAATMDYICEDGEKRLTDRRRRAGSDLAADASAAIADRR